MIKWIKNKIAEWKYKRKMKKKLEELKKKVQQLHSDNEGRHQGE